VSLVQGLNLPSSEKRAAKNQVIGEENTKEENRYVYKAQSEEKRAKDNKIDTRRGPFILFRRKRFGTKDLVCVEVRGRLGRRRDGKGEKGGKESKKKERLNGA